MHGDKGAVERGARGGDVPMRPVLLPERPSVPEEGVTAGQLARGVAVVVGGLLAGWSVLAMLGASVGFPALGPFGAVDVLGVGLVVALAPVGFHAAGRVRRVRRLEDRFPDFLRDVAANKRAGIPLSLSVQRAAQADYGALTPEVKRMADQLSWTIPFEEVLERFADRVDTPLVHRACTLILEAEYTGGHVTDVLEAVARDVRALQTLKAERRSEMAMYTIVVYLTFFVFLGVAAMLYGQFLPELLVAQEVDQGLAGAAGGLVGGASVSLEDYRQFFYVATMVQAVGSGVLAGVLSHDAYGPGLRHAAVMVGVAAVVFGLFAV